MFQISCNITKAAKAKNGKFVIQGIASDTSIDRDQERFDSEAIVKMKDHIKKSPVPLRVEHLEGWHNVAGKVVDASINNNGQLIVEAEIDQEMSAGRDFVHVCKLAQEGLAKMPGFSVAGLIKDAGMEFVKEMGRNIKVYKDIILEEISLVTNPSNYNVTMNEVSFAKSINWKKVEKGIIESTKAGNKVYERVSKSAKIDEIYSVSYDNTQIQNWNVLKSFISLAHTSEAKKLDAVDTFAQYLSKGAEEAGVTISKDKLQESVEGWREAVTKNSSHLPLNTYLQFFMKTMQYGSAGTVTLNPTELQNGISFYDAEHAPEYLKSFFERTDVAMVQVEKADKIENVTPLTGSEWSEIEKSLTEPEKTEEKVVEKSAEEEGETTTSEVAEVESVTEVLATEGETTTDSEQQTEVTEEKVVSTDTETSSTENGSDSLHIEQEKNEEKMEKSVSTSSTISNSLRLFAKQYGEQDTPSVVLDSLLKSTKGVFESAGAFAALDSRKLTKSSNELTKFSTSLLTALPILSTALFYTEDVAKGEGVEKMSLPSIIGSFAKDHYAGGLSPEDMSIMETLMSKSNMWEDGNMQFMMAGMMYFLNMLVCYKVEQYLWDFVLEYDLADVEMDDYDMYKSTLENTVKSTFTDEVVASLPDTSFAFVKGEGESVVRQYPYKDSEGTVNKNAVVLGMKQLLSNKESIDPAVFKSAFDVLMQEMKSLTVVKSETEKVKTEEKVAEKSVDVYAELDKVLKSQSTDEEITTNAETDSEEEGGTTDIEEVAKSFSGHKFSKQMDKVVKYMTKVEEALQKSTAENTALNEKVVEMEGILTKSVQLLDKVASAPMGRKSLSTYAAIQKSASTDNENMTFEQLLEHNAQVAEKSNTPFAEAYKSAKNGVKL